MKTVKSILTIFLAMAMALSMAACSGSNTGKSSTDVNMTAQEVLDAVKNSLGDSYTSDTAETEDRMTGYYGLDMSRIDSWAAESNSNPSLSMDCTVILKVKDGYAKDAAALLQQSYEQVRDYAKMYNMDLYRVLQGRLFINGDYVALIIEGKEADYNASEEDQAAFARDEAAKTDAAWKDIFGSAENTLSAS